MTSFTEGVVPAADEGADSSVPRPHPALLAAVWSLLTDGKQRRMVECGWPRRRLHSARQRRPSLRLRADDASARALVEPPAMDPGWMLRIRVGEIVAGSPPGSVVHGQWHGSSNIIGGRWWLSSWVGDSQLPQQLPLLQAWRLPNLHQERNIRILYRYFFSFFSMSCSSSYGSCVDPCFVSLFSTLYAAPRADLLFFFWFIQIHCYRSPTI
jgi:hypothetical protein